MVISRTPFRISFFGGGTDYPAWYKKNGGQVLATSINKYCYLNARYLPPFFGYKYRIAYSLVENCKTINQIRHPSVKAILNFLKLPQGVEIHYDGDLPAKSGTGSSSAFTVGLLHALYALTGHKVSKEKLANESIYLEQEVIKETVGSQDQISASYGGFNLVTFQKNGLFSINPVDIPTQRLQELEDHLMLFYTGIERTAADVAKSYVEDIEKREKQLNQISGMVTTAVEILNSKQKIKYLGELLNESWQIKRSLSSEVSNSEIDRLYKTALSFGAIGGKLIGAGGGGFILLFVSPSNQSKIKKEFSKLIHVPFKFEYEGSKIIFHDPEDDLSLEK